MDELIETQKEACINLYKTLRWAVRVSFNFTLVRKHVIHAVTFSFYHLIIFKR